MKNMLDESNNDLLLNLSSTEMLEKTNLALINILEDFTEDKKHEEELHKGVMNILEDLNDEKRITELLNDKLQHEIAEHNRALTKLMIANQDLETFSYSVSHDLRAPLRHITGFIQLLQKTTQSTFDDKAIRYMETISDSAKRMGLLIDELLQFSRLGRAELQTQLVKFDQLVNEVIMEFQNDITGRNVNWEIGSLPTIEADRVLIRQVIINLISNALKFTKERNPAVIVIDSHLQENGFYLFWVKDNGVGFDHKYINKLFGVFQRLHSNFEFEGNGIGLAIIKSIINKHGGEVRAEGEINKGATFYFTLKS
jgi:light-regulated signal transduction histidine kinase (bacteriophytochrome)